MHGYYKPSQKKLWDKRKQKDPKGRRNKNGWKRQRENYYFFE